MLTILGGLPASGKSTWVAENGTTAIILCPDDFRKAMSDRDFFAPIEDFVWGVVKTTARVLLDQGRDVIIDATHLTVGSRSQWVRLAQEYGTPIRCVWFETSLTECKRRNLNRTHKVPDDVMDRMAKTTVAPSGGEGFEQISYVTCENAAVSGS